MKKLINDTHGVVDDTLAGLQNAPGGATFFQQPGGDLATHPATVSGSIIRSASEKEGGE